MESRKEVFGGFTVVFRKDIYTEEYLSNAVELLKPHYAFFLSVIVTLRPLQKKRVVGEIFKSIFTSGMC